MIFCLFRLVFLFRFHSLRVSQSGNNISVAVTCHLVACILHNPNLTELVLDHQPSACIGHDAWRSEGLPGSEGLPVLLLPPAEVGAKKLTAWLEYMRKVTMQNGFQGLPVSMQNVFQGLPVVSVLSLEDAEWTAVLRSLREVSMQIIFRRPAQSGLLFFFVLFVLHLPLALPGRSQQIRAPDV